MFYLIAGTIARKLGFKVVLIASLTFSFILATKLVISKIERGAILELEFKQAQLVQAQYEQDMGNAVRIKDKLHQDLANNKARIEALTNDSQDDSNICPMGCVLPK